MVRLPTYIRRKAPVPNDQRKHFEALSYNELAGKLEAFLNNLELDGSEPQSFTYGEIAAKIGFPIEVVSEILFTLESGHNGVTVFRRARS